MVYFQPAVTLNSPFELAASCCVVPPDSMPSSASAIPAMSAVPSSLTSSSSSSSLLSADASPDHVAKRLSPSLSPVLSDHQLPALGSLSQRSSTFSTSNSASSTRVMSPPLRALRRRSKSVSSFSSMLLQHSSSLPVLMKPYLSSSAATVAKPVLPLSDTCSPLNIPSDAASLPSLHPCLSPSVGHSQGGDSAFVRPRSKSFSVYEDEQAAAQHRGRINARLPALRVARIAERPAVHVIHDKRTPEEQPPVESKEEVENEVDGQSDGVDESPTCPVNPMLSPVVEADKEFFSALSP